MDLPTDVEIEGSFDISSCGKQAIHETLLGLEVWSGVYFYRVRAGLCRDVVHEYFGFLGEREEDAFRRYLRHIVRE